MHPTTNFSQMTKTRKLSFSVVVLSIVKLLSIVLVLGVSLLGLIAKAEPLRVFTGKAYDLKTGEFVYSEKNIYDDDPLNTTLITEYFDPLNKPIGERTINFKNDRIADYVFTQNQLKNEERIIRETSELRYTLTLNGKSTEKSHRTKRAKDVVISAGAINHIEREWTQLLAGNKIVYDFAIPLPAKRRIVKMVVQQSDNTIASEFMPEEKLITFTIKISNRLIRWLMDTIVIGYYQDTEKLAFYKGPTNLRNENNKNMKPVYVIFER